MTLAEMLALAKTTRVARARYRTIAWVHPRQGGDDYAIVLLSATRPTAAEIAAELRAHGSAVLDDAFTIDLNT